MSSSAPFLSGSNNAIYRSSDVSLTLNPRILELEARLEKAEADADRARLDLSVHLIRSQIAQGPWELPSLEASQVPSSQSTKKRSKRKVPAEGPESDSNIAGSKKRKKPKALIAETDITLSTLLKHLAASSLDQVFLLLQ
jgi:hypothetical protein